MPLNLTNAVQTAQQLLAYTAEAPNFSDKVDVIFVAEMIEKIGKFAEKYKEVSQIKSYRGKTVIVLILTNVQQYCSECFFSATIFFFKWNRLLNL